jgi:hypothetical protein
MMFIDLDVSDEVLMEIHRIVKSSKYQYLLKNIVFTLLH